MISLGLRRKAPLEVELFDLPLLIAHDAPRQDFEASRQRLGVAARMGLDQADDDVDALLAQQPRALQHRVGLADAGRGAQEHQQSAALFLFRQRQQGVRVRSTLGISLVGQGTATSPIPGDKYSA